MIASPVRTSKEMRSEGFGEADRSTYYKCCKRIHVIIIVPTLSTELHLVYGFGTEPDSKLCCDATIEEAATGCRMS